MKPNTLIKELMKRNGFTCKSLADEMGKPAPSYVSNPLCREKGMRIDTFLEMVSAMGYEVVVRKDNDELPLSNSEIDFDLNLDELLG